MTRVNDVVTAAIATVITRYTTLLGLVYATTAKTGKLFTPVAVVPAVFRGRPGANRAAREASRR
jgi:hypothetical protein